jgi:peptidoglycan hydrolase CwlO-like protein
MDVPGIPWPPEYPEEVHMEVVKKAQKELYVEMKLIEKEVQSLQAGIAEVKALGHSAQEEELKMEKLIKRLEETRQRIEDLWRFSVPYGRA